MGIAVQEQLLNIHSILWLRTRPSVQLSARHWAQHLVHELGLMTVLEWVLDSMALPLVTLTGQMKVLMLAQKSGMMMDFPMVVQSGTKSAQGVSVLVLGRQ